ncbi:PAS domain-containing protein [Natronomonas salina]|uniref:PAS domain-containing protein n=1 Tax=Natronomonas salina TaxID=1710540 RepID=UPI003CCDB8D7
MAERRYRTLVENFPNGAVGLFDEDLRYTAAGGRAFSDLDDSEAEVVGETIWERYPEELAEKLEPRFEAALRGEASDFELEFHDRVWMAHTHPIEDDGEVSGGVIIVQDVTDRKERERELELSEQRYRTLVENFPNGAVALVDDEFRYQTVGGTPPEGIELTTDQLVGERVQDALPPALAEKLSASYEAAFDGESSSFEYESGDFVYRFHTVPVRDDDGDVFAAMGISQDVTEQKGQERRLRAAKAQLETLFDVLPVGVVVADADGRILQANDTAEEIWGGDVFDVDSVAEYERYPVREADSGETVPPEEMTLARVIDGEEVTEPDVYEIDAFDGERRVVRLEGRPIRDDAGRVTRGVVTLTEITERREYQQRLEESNERLEQFAYAASHDLQEPLRMVTSYLQLLERRYGDELGEDGQEFVDFAVDGAERMREMIDALLEYSRVETRGDPFEPVDLDEALEDVTRDVQVRVEETDAEITAEDLPTVRGDPSQLRQVFQNLLSNALEYSGEEPPRIHVDAERSGDEWVLSVADEGIGIEPDQHERVFEVFQRLHSRDEHEGTGIGLALTRRIVERHGGDVWVESAPGEGSTFYFTLPVGVERDG